MKFEAQLPVLNPGNTEDKHKLHTCLSKGDKHYCLIQYVDDINGVKYILSEIYSTDSACEASACKSVGDVLLCIPMISEEYTMVLKRAGIFNSYEGYEKYCEVHAVNFPSHNLGLELFENDSLTSLMDVLLGENQRKYLQLWTKKIGSNPLDEYSVKKIEECLEYKAPEYPLRSSIAKHLFRAVKRAIKKQKQPVTENMAVLN